MKSGKLDSTTSDGLELTEDFLTNDFSGGMYLADVLSNLLDTQYSKLVNGRTRFGGIQPVRKPLDITRQVAQGRFQSVYGMNNYLLVFVDGLAYLRDLRSPDDTFSAVPGFQQMSSDVDKIYAQNVPQSDFNFVRSGGPHDIILRNIDSGLPQAFICQDGTSRPRLIFSNGNSRIAQTFEQWKVDFDDPTKDFREYIPVGKQMLYFNGICYIISADSKELYRSVDGRPTDFVLAVDENGNKLSALSQGREEASRLSYRISTEDMIALSELNSSSNQGLGGFLVSTANTVYIIVPDYNQTLYGQPTFDNIPIIPIGILNNESLANSLGDTIFISSLGAVSFNAVGITQDIAKNSPFTRAVSKLFEGVTQTVTAATTFDDYTFLAMNSIHGNIVLVYDNQQEVFVGYDKYEDITLPIKQFAKITVNGEPRLFFITGSGLYEAFAGDGLETVQLYTKEYTREDTTIASTLDHVNISFDEIEESEGTVELREFVDGKSVRESALMKSLRGDFSIQSVPKAFPLGDSSKRNLEVIPFDIKNSIQGNKIGLMISFNFQAKLNAIQLRTILEQKEVSQHNQSQAFQSIIEGN
jgi:hypothetical protein